jgi:hypothetical protein
MAEDRTLQIWHGHDHNGTRTMTATLYADGHLGIEGQDLGEAVKFFGGDHGEYEFAWSASTDAVPRIVELLGGQPGDDALALLKLWAEEHKGMDPGEFLKQGGAEIGFWSRLGD